MCVCKVFNDWPLLVYVLPYLLTFSLLPLILLSSPATIQFLCTLIGNLKYDTVNCTCCILFYFLLSPLKSCFDHITHGNWSCLSHQESLFCQTQWSISPHLFYLSVTFGGVYCLLLLERVSFLIFQNTGLGVFLLPYGLLLLSLLCLFHFFPLTLKVEILQSSDLILLSFLFILDLDGLIQYHCFKYHLYI